MVKRRLVETPVLAALVGAFCIAFSGILFRVAHVSPSTGAFFRCLWAVPPLWWLARREDRRYGPRSRRARLLAAAAGAFFAVDLVAWHHAVEEVGAGLATVLGNLQVVLVAPIAWVLLKERPRGRTLAAMPIALGGVVLISGAIGSGAYGRNPGLGALNRREPIDRTITRSTDLPILFRLAIIKYLGHDHGTPSTAGFRRCAHRPLQRGGNGAGLFRSRW